MPVRVRLLIHLRGEVAAANGNHARANAAELGTNQGRDAEN